jgi:hypothetical protein
MSFLIDAADVLVADIIGLLQFEQRWGIYQDGELVLAPDNIVDFGFRHSWRLPTYPQEQGAFQNYNKVQTPFDVKIRMTRGGSVQDRQDFLDSSEAIAGSLDLYDVVTPEAVYIGANVTNYDYRRTAQAGAGLITVDFTLLEIRVTAEAAFSNTKDPSSAAKVDGGTVQGGDPVVQKNITITPVVR